jgi:hypothetical protein
MKNFKQSQHASDLAALRLMTGTVTFTDPDCYRASFRHGKIKLCFTAPSQFKARLTRAELSHLCLFDAAESVPRIAHLCVSAEKTFVMFAADPDPPQFWDGLKFGSWDIMLIHRYRGRIHHRTSGASHWGLMSIDPVAFTAHHRALTGLKSVQPQRSTLRPTWSAAVRMRKLHAKTCELAQTTPDMIAHEEVTRALENDLLYALISCLGA